ncbi:hypothetical protein DV736_g1541, partial [Chaetothyriales sp. CBS 134916]
MKTLAIATALFASASMAWAPSCGWNDCFGSWDGASCDQSNGWDCLCSNGTAIAQLNTCVATSCTNATDQEAIYAAVAQICVNNGNTVTNTQQATFSATSGGTLSQITANPSGWGPSGGWGSGAWSSWISACSTGLPGAPSGWGGPGNGPWSGAGGWGGHGGGFGGPGGAGPWGTKASGVNCDNWTTWTGGWGPFSSWTGTWSGCSTTTATPSPATITTTVTTGGTTQVLTGTTFGIQAVSQTVSTTTSSNTASGSTFSHLPHGLPVFAAVAGTKMDATVADEASNSMMRQCSDSAMGETTICEDVKGMSLTVLPLVVNHEHSKVVDDGHDQVVSDMSLCPSKRRILSRAEKSAESTTRGSLRSHLGLLSFASSLGIPKRSRSGNDSHSLSEISGDVEKAAPFSLIVSLPKDIFIFLISRYLDFNSLLALRGTCKAMRNSMPLELLARIRADIVLTLRAAEKLQLSAYRTAHRRQPLSHLWDLFYSTYAWQLQERPATHLTCYGCLELKPLHAFVERMSSRGTGLGGRCAELRRCKDCMCRYLSIGGVWWREHWVRKSDTVRRRGRVERWARWVTRGERLVKVPKDDERGVCRVCGVFDELSRTDRAVKWLIEMTEEWSSSRARKRRVKCARRRENGSWWFRVIRGSVSWEGSWEGRVEALVEHLNGKDIDAPPDEQEQNDKRAACEQLRHPPTQPGIWKALDQLPLKMNRREQRCSACWEPCLFRDPVYILGMAYAKPLSFDRWCQVCQQEQRDKAAKRQQNVVNNNGIDTSEEIVESMRMLFA